MTTAPVSTPDGEESPQARRSRIVGSVLAPAVQLWLRTQVEHVEDLQVRIEGGDRQILSGYIPQVNLSACKAIYQGLHLSQVNLVGQNIRVNLGQVVRGKPLRLLEPIALTGALCLLEADLNASLQAPLLGNAVAEFFSSLLGLPGSQLCDPQAKFRDQRLHFQATLMAADRPLPIQIETGLAIEDQHILHLHDFQWLSEPRPTLPMSLVFDLGSETQLETLTLSDDRIVCQGRLTVTPEA